MVAIKSVQKEIFWRRNKSLRKFLEPSKKTKVTYTDNSLEFGKSCEEPSWNHCTSTAHSSETSGIAERAVRRIKEPLQYCHTAAWMRNGGRIPLNVPVMCEMFKMGKHLTNGDFENHSKDQLFRLVQW